MIKVQSVSELKSPSWTTAHSQNMDPAMCSLLSKFRYLSTTEDSFWLYSEFLSYIRFSYVAKFLLSLYWVPPIWAISYGSTIGYILIWHVMTPSYIIQAIGDCTAQNWISYIDVAEGCLRQSIRMIVANITSLTYPYQQHHWSNWKYMWNHIILYEIYRIRTVTVPQKRVFVK